MLTLVALLCLASAHVAAQGGAESLSFPGYLPGDYVRALKPIGDNRPNDVYQHLPARQPALTSEEVVIYPHHFGFEYGVDPENSIYEITNAKELVARHNKKLSKKHHGKHGKQHAHKHAHQHAHKHQDAHEHHHEHHHEHQAQASEQSSTYVEQETPQFRPRPAYPPKGHQYN